MKQKIYSESCFYLGLNNLFTLVFLRVLRGQLFFQEDYESVEICVDPLNPRHSRLIIMAFYHIKQKESTP